MIVTTYAELEEARKTAHMTIDIGAYRPGVTFVAMRISEDDKQMHDEATDDDGHAILAIGHPIFSLGYDEVLAKLVVPQGTDRRELVKILRKFIEMIKSDDGKDVLNLYDGWKGPNRAQRFPDGRIEVFNTDQKFKEYEEERRVQEELAAAAKKSPPPGKPRTKVRPNYRRGLTKRGE